MAQLQDNINRFNYEQNIDDQKLQNYMGVVGGGTVGSQSIQPVFRNQGASALGGAMGGAQLAGMINPTLIAQDIYFSVFNLVLMVGIVLIMIRTNWRISRAEGTILVVINLFRWYFDFSS